MYRRLPLAFLLLFSGCIVRAFHPLYTDRDIVFESAGIHGQTYGNRGRV